VGGLFGFVFVFGMLKPLWAGNAFFVPKRKIKNYAPRLSGTCGDFFIEAISAVLDFTLL
jgi:hypothetical protein